MLFHELFHAFSALSGTQDKSLLKGAQRFSFGSVDEFIAVPITNLYSSETGRLLRATGRPDHEALEGVRATSKGFLDIDEEYPRLIRKFISQHPKLCKQLRDVPCKFNPIREILVGQEVSVPAKRAIGIKQKHSRASHIQPKTSVRDRRVREPGGLDWNSAYMVR